MHIPVTRISKAAGCTCSRRIATALAAALVVASLAACGGKKSSTSTEVTVAVSPVSATLQTKQTQQFTATVTNSSNSSVTWQVNGIAGGTTATGTISTSGLYTAPAIVPTPSSVTITAILQADTTKTGTATVSITNSGLAVVVTPSAATVTAGGQQTFVATVGSTVITPVWSVNCQSQVPGGCGAINTGGVYTAPLSPPPGGTVSITAATSDNTSITGSASVTIQFGNGSLRGPYAFSLSGAAGGNFFGEIGVLTFDGGGRVTAGFTDRYLQGAAFRSDNSGGTYQIGPDGRGTITTASMVWQVALAGSGHGMALETNNAIATGTFDAQSTGEFQLSSLSSNYTLAANGVTRSLTSPLAMVGGLTLDGAGHITGGTLDVNGPAPLSGASATGTISAPDANGTGQISLATSTGPFALTYYMIDASHLRVVENDINGIAIGDFVRQGSAISNSSLRNAFAFSFTGPGPSGALAGGGTMTLDGSGNIIAGVLDNLSNSQTNASLSGTYSVTNTGTGRVAATLTTTAATLHLVLYPRFDGTLAFIQADVGLPAHGVAFVQVPGPFDPSLLKGTVAALLSGNGLSDTQTEDAIGQFNMTGGSSFTGTMTVDAAGTIQTGSSFQAGSYLVARDTGRGTASISSSNSRLNGTTLYVYPIDAHRALILLGGSAQPMAGIIQQQF